MKGLERSARVRLSRRQFLRAGGAAALSLPLFFRPGPAAGATGPERAPLLVVVFLRGGADGLALVPPLGDRALRSSRPGLVPRGALEIDDGFALHPALAPIEPFYREGRLAVVHAVGLPDPVRSHFDAQDACERGGARPGTAVEGWLARAVAASGPGNDALPAVALTRGRPLALDGDPRALAFESVRALRAPASSPAAREALTRLFQAEGSAPAAARVARAGREALAVVDRVRRHATGPLPTGSDFGRGRLAGRLATLARLARAEPTLGAAWVDAGGWDTHVGQGNEEGVLARQAGELARALAGFVHSLEQRADDLLLLVFSEFGRTVEPNGSGGTDHGCGGVALALGGPVTGGRVFGRWPGLAREQREEGRDLRVTTDVREILAEGARHLGAWDAGAVLPGYAPAGLGLVRPASERYPLPGSSIPL